MLHNLFTIAVSGRRQEGWILLLPTVDATHFLITQCHKSKIFSIIISNIVWKNKNQNLEKSKNSLLQFSEVNQKRITKLVIKWIDEWNFFSIAHLDLRLMSVLKSCSPWIDFPLQLFVIAFLMNSWVPDWNMDNLILQHLADQFKSKFAFLGQPNIAIKLRSRTRACICFR